MRVSMYRSQMYSGLQAPRDKLVCILNCCRVLNNVLQTASAGSHEARGGCTLPTVESFFSAIKTFRLLLLLLLATAHLQTGTVHSADNGLRCLVVHGLSPVYPAFQNSPAALMEMAYQLACSTCSSTSS